MRIRASCERDGKKRLHASSTRNGGILIRCKPQAGLCPPWQRVRHRMRYGFAARAREAHAPGRKPALGRALAGNGVVGFHDISSLQFSGRFVWFSSRHMQRRSRTVNSLYSLVNNFHNRVCPICRIPSTPCPIPPSSAGKTPWHCSSNSRQALSPRVLRPRAWSKVSRPRCRYRPACGARSNRPGRWATSSRASSKPTAQNQPAGWTRFKAIVWCQTRPKNVSWNSRAVRGARRRRGANASLRGG